MKEIYGIDMAKTQHSKTFEKNICCGHSDFYGLRRGVPYSRAGL